MSLIGVFTFVVSITTEKYSAEDEILFNNAMNATLVEPIEHYINVRKMNVND